MSSVTSVESNGDHKSESIFMHDDLRFVCRTFGTVIDYEAHVVQLEADFRIGEMKKPKHFRRNLRNAPFVNTVTFEPYTITVTYGALFDGGRVANEVMWIARSAFAPTLKLISEAVSERLPNSENAMYFEVKI